MSKKQLTPAEEAEVQDYLDNELVDDKTWIKSLHELTKDHKRVVKELKDLEKFQRKVERGEIKTRKYGLDGWEEITADMSHVTQITKLDRPWTEAILIDVLLDLRCLADLHLYSDDTGVEDAE